VRRDDLLGVLCQGVRLGLHSAFPVVGQAAGSADQVRVRVRAPGRPGVGLPT
jgi:hypothetical protein